MIIWVASSVGFLCLKLLWTLLYKSDCGYMFSFLLHKYLGVDLVGHTVDAPLTLQKTAKQFFKVILSFYDPISNVWELQMLHLLTSCRCWSLGVVSLSSGCRVVAQDYNSCFLVMLRNFYVFICIYMSSFVKWEFNYFSMPLHSIIRLQRFFI